MAECRCGRIITLQKPHCKTCGSTYVMYRKRASRLEKVRNAETGEFEIVNIRAYSCRRCGAEFSEDQPCLAEPVEHTATRVDIQAARRALNRAAAGQDGFAHSRPDPATLRWELAKRNPRLMEDLVARNVNVTCGDDNIIIEQVRQIIDGATLAPAPTAQVQQHEVRGAARGEYHDDFFSPATQPATQQDAPQPQDKATEEPK